jgi:putative aldouronate transport system substrate-binding protein
MTSDRMDRRKFLRGMVMGAGASVLAACGAATQPNATLPTAAPAATAVPEAAATVAATAVPEATAAATAVADAAAGFIPGGMDGVPDAYTAFPSEFRQTVMTPPGKGGSFRTMQFVYQPPVPPVGENNYWQELNKRLNAEALADLVPADSFTEKFATTLAGGDLPEIMTINPHFDGAHLDAIKQGAISDLTPYLEGDAINTYPNLAALPAYLWTSSRVDGKIVGVPRETGRVSSVLVFRQDWAEKIGNPQPKNAQEFFDLMVAFSKEDPDGSGSPDTYGLAGFQYASPWLKFIFRVPNAWRRNDDGTLTNEIETEEFKQMIEWQRQLFEAGGYHPDAANINHKEEFIAGKIGAYNDGIGALPGSTGMRFRTKAVNPDAKVVGLVPFGHDGGAALSHNNRGYWGMASIASTVSDQARVQELLAILDYYAAPYGSEEWLFLRYGVEGTQHTVNADGTRTLTEQGKKEIGDLNYLAFPGIVLSYDVPGDAEEQQNLFREYVAIGVDNPADAYTSATEAERGGELWTLVNDTVNDLVTGRQPFSAFDTLVADWKSRGGDQIREEYQQQLG